MKKEDLHQVIDGVASLLKVGLSNLIDEGNTLAQAARQTAQSATRSQAPGNDAPPNDFTLLEELTRTNRQLNGDPEQVYRVLGVRSLPDQNQTQVYIEMVRGNWRSVRELSDVLNDPITSR
jgi:hypothetical protein